MRISPKCPACLLNRVQMESRLATDSEEVIAAAVGEALKVLCQEYPKRGINAVIATKMHRRVYEVLGSEDPYRALKEKANSIAMRYRDWVEEVVRKSDDSFKTALVASIIANTFDYGVMGHSVQDDAFKEFFERKLNDSLAIDDSEDIRSLAGGKVVYITDNAGEIVMDAVFMKEIKKISEKLTAVVRGKPIISDATLEDAYFAGIDRIADELLTNGEGAVGIIEEELPEETLQRLEDADVIIAKGMANYECMDEMRFSPVAFLLTAKCEPVARSIGVKVGDMVAMLRR